MPTCLYTGHAAGSAAALAITNGIPPDQCDGTQVRRLVVGP